MISKATKTLNEPVDCVSLVGAKTLRLLNKIGITSIRDLITHYPYKHLDLSTAKKIGNLNIGELASVVGIVKSISKRKIKPGLDLLEIGIFDASGYLYGTWFNQSYIANTLKEGSEVVFSGPIEYKFNKLQIQNPLYESLSPSNEQIHTLGIIPFHPSTAGLSTKMLRRIIRSGLEVADVLEVLPDSIIKKFDLMDRKEAIRSIHFPKDKINLDKAKERLVFEELFLLQTALLYRKYQCKQAKTGFSHKVKGELIDNYYSRLPFELTNDQKKAIDEIANDMACSLPMHRLVLGEVGSGKTAVALFGLIAAVQNGNQAAIMAPTEILAFQHYEKIKPLCDCLGINILLLTSNLKSKEKTTAQLAISSGDIDIVIGTTALIQKDINFHRLSLVVIDEQHRFGVAQRTMLKEKGVSPDMLVLTATPIPRTIAVTLYGDLDISLIKELPHGKDFSKHVQTFVCSPKKYEQAYEKIRQEVSEGRQAFIVCPLIEESDKLEAKAVMAEIENLRNNIFPKLRVEALHGKLKTDEKESIMERFRNGRLDVLISTTVIEVGIDIKNATVMLIEDADRFGLAQLHQLRGRVGRGEHKSFCILFSKLKTDEARARMSAIKNLKNGFDLAEADLEIRGEGELLGIKQSGLSDLKIAKLARDKEVLFTARAAAKKLIALNPTLSHSQNKVLATEIKDRFGEKIELLFSG
ncbi:MAG: ATP-dependent DNA helicase RecG [Actinobacteria bacterium]|nr:MAG: ATP-dependent DNA helicase RecG [Actinomycetota bacterium]